MSQARFFQDAKPLQRNPEYEASNRSEAAEHSEAFEVTDPSLNGRDVRNAGNRCFCSRRRVRRPGHDARRDGANQETRRERCVQSPPLLCAIEQRDRQAQDNRMAQRNRERIGKNARSKKQATMTAGANAPNKKAHIHGKIRAMFIKPPKLQMTFRRRI
jgi:hypothetical protein